MKLLALTKGKSAIVDDDLFDFLSQWKWCFDGHKYAVRNYLVNKVNHRVYMHRLIAQTPDGLLTDHINGDPLDNRRENLRNCTASENQLNTRLRKIGKSGYRGICFNEKAKTWIVQIRVGGYKTKEEAVKVYNRLAKVAHGDFAKLNKIEQS